MLYILVPDETRGATQIHLVVSGRTLTAPAPEVGSAQLFQMVYTYNDLTNLASKRMNVSLLAVAMMVSSFAALVSGLFVINRRCWVVPCAHRHRGDHGELLGLKVRSGDSFSALITNVAALAFAWWCFQMFFMGGASSLTSSRFIYLRGFSVALTIQLFVSSMLWLEEAGTVATFVHRGQHHINSPGLTATIPNIHLLHAMQSLALFSTLTFLLGAGIAVFLFQFRSELLPENEYQSISSSDDSNNNGGQMEIDHDNGNGPGSSSKRKHGKKKRRMKKKAGSDFDVENNNNVFDDVKSEDL